VIGRLASELADDPGAQRLDEAARRVAETGEPSISEDALFDSRKEEVFVTTRTPLRDDAGKIIGVIIASKDVSELRHGERERTRLAGEVRRREAVSALGALVGSVAHEVRNPLFAISSTLDAVVARFRGQPDLTPFLDVLKRETVRLNAIMNELLEYGRARAEELRPDRVEPAVETAVELCRPQAIARRVQLDLRVNSGLPTVSMDRDRLVMAMRNVVDNAIRHAPAGSTVSVRVGLQPENGGGVEFQVRDRGPGFSPEVLQRLFEPFITQRPGGIGLGLYLVKRVVEDHGGRVSVENAFDGGGLVRLWIPHDGAQAGGPRDAVA
jgi:signal transduction histidine kinase